MTDDPRTAPNDIDRDNKGPRVAYFVSRFPKISETFILKEIARLQATGLTIDIFPLVIHQNETSHPEARDLMKRVHGCSLFSLQGLGCQLYWIRKKPKVYFKTWLEVLWGHVCSPRFLLRSLVVLIKSASFARRVEQLGCDHMHAHWATHGALTAYVVSALTGIPYGFTAHAHDIYLPCPMLEKKVRAAGYVVTISDYNREFLGRRLGDSVLKKIKVIRCGVNPEEFHPPAEKPAPPPLRILCVATLRDYKGYPDLVEACRLLRDRGVDFVCDCIGEGVMRARIERLISDAELGDRVRLPGARPWQDVRDHLARAHVFVLPSIVTRSGRREGIPVSLMEAMATEVPVVATRISGIPELMTDGRTGLLVEQRDPQGLAQALQKIAQDPAAARSMGTAGRRKVLQDYNLATNTDRLRSLILETIDSERRLVSTPGTV